VSALWISSLRGRQRSLLGKFLFGISVLMTSSLLVDKRISAPVGFPLLY